MQSCVFVPQPIHADALEMLRGQSQLLVGFGDSAVSWAEGLATAHGIVIRTAPFTEADVEAAPHLKAIARHGVGVDNIDIAAATVKGIAILNTPWANVESVAEHALLGMLALAKRLLASDRATRAGMFQKRDALLGTELKGKTLGVIGFGRIGREVARKCRLAFAMRVLVYDPHLKGTPGGLERRERLEDLLAEADVVSLHLPLTPETRQLIGRRELRRMKRGAFLVNLARGGIIDEEALYEALKDNHLAGAALDVFEEEPPRPDHPLFSLDNVVLTPHNAAHTREAFRRMAVGAAEALLSYLCGEEPEHVVNPQVLLPEGVRR